MKRFVGSVIWVHGTEPSRCPVAYEYLEICKQMLVGMLKEDVVSAVVLAFEH